MNVQVNLFENDVPLSVKKSITVKQLFDHVSSQIGLKTKSFFGLQAFDRVKGAMVWAKPSKQLSAVIKKTIEIEQTFPCLYLRVRSFPDNFETIKEDKVAMRLFYREMRQKWSKGFNSELPSEIALLSLQLLIEFGPINTLGDNVNLADLVKRNLTSQTNDSKLATEMVFRLWNAFGQMTSDEAIAIYVNIVINSECQYETMPFAMKVFNEESKINIEVCYTGIEIRKGTDLTTLSWPLMRKVSRRDRRIILKLIDKDFSKLSYQCNSKYMAKRLFKVIVAYHRMHMHRKFSYETTCGFLELPNPEKIFLSLVDSSTLLQSTPNYGNSEEKNDLSIQRLGEILERFDEWAGQKEESISQRNEQMKVIFIKAQQMLAMSRKILQKISETKLETDSVTKEQQQEDQWQTEQNISQFEEQMEQDLGDELSGEEHSEMKEDEKKMPICNDVSEDVIQEDTVDTKISGQMSQLDADELTEQVELVEKDLQNVESTRRKRFAKLRLSLFEHERY